MTLGIFSLLRSRKEFRGGPRRVTSIHEDGKESGDHLRVESSGRRCVSVTVGVPLNLTILTPAHHGNVKVSVHPYPVQYKVIRISLTTAS